MIIVQPLLFELAVENVSLARYKFAAECLRLLQRSIHVLILKYGSALSVVKFGLKMI